MNARTYESVSVGDALPSREVRVRQGDLVRYAGASRDYNPIHWNERVAVEVGLPGVIAHGMLAMALVGTVITDWAGDAGAIVEFVSRFVRPIVVPQGNEGAPVELSGKVGEKRDDNTVRVTVVAKYANAPVCKATAVVRLA